MKNILIAAIAVIFLGSFGARAQEAGTPSSGGAASSDTGADKKMDKKMDKKHKHGKKKKKKTPASIG